jgi:ribosomal protein S18 acetylase RimI-like enzyme
MADERGVVTYLETADDNRARGLYERLGFQERGRETIRDLSKFASTEDMERVGVEIEHTHVGFVRDPKQRKD